MNRNRNQIAIVVLALMLITGIVVALLWTDNETVLVFKGEKVTQGDIEVVNELEKTRVLTRLVEGIVWESVGATLNVELEDEDIQEYIKASHPEIDPGVTYERRQESMKPLLLALEGVVLNGEPGEVMYKEYLTDLLTVEQWKVFLSKNSNKNAVSAIRKSVFDESREDYIQRTIEAFREQVVSELIRKSICDLTSVEANIKREIGKINLKRGRTADFEDAATTGVKNYQCLKESNSWLQNYFLDNLELVDEKYKGFHTRLSFFQPLPFEQ